MYPHLYGSISDNWVALEKIPHGRRIQHLIGYIKARYRDKVNGTKSSYTLIGLWCMRSYKSYKQRV